jgi:epoxyqueuosine reductase
MSAGSDTTAALTQAIRREAHALGFSHVGFAPAEQLTEEGEALRRWLDLGYQAGMRWMERDTEKRCDPSLVLPGARTVISLAHNYYTAQQHSGHEAAGKISRYAWGDDYHTVVERKLGQLEQRINELAPTEKSRRYVDTGPVMDKAWAVRAGIGWLGKNGNVITRDYGSWVFLAEILTTLPVDYDTAIPDYCGSCTACIDACPTQAIVSPGVIDSGRCISYMTIEHRGDELPLEEGMDMQQWVFGCDICQDVCPWNSFAKESDEPAFLPRSWNIDPPLIELASLDDEEFRSRYKGSAIKRCKPAGLRRNARIVLNRKESNVE